jgi:probable rRNA maturation factor
MAASHKIDITRRKQNLGRADAYRTLRRAVRAALAAEGVTADCAVSIMLTDDAGIREINREFRGIDAATDVLSFPFNTLIPGEFDPSDCETDPETGRILLGDMVISVPRCEQQGTEFGHGFDREIAYLAVHSTLHLLGYDHMDEGAQKRLMRSREKTIMASLGAAEPD